MRKYFLGLCMLCFSCIAWSEVNDTLNIIPKEEISKIEEKYMRFIIKESEGVCQYLNGGRGISGS